MHQDGFSGNPQPFCSRDVQHVTVLVRLKYHQMLCFTLDVAKDSSFPYRPWLISRGALCQGFCERRCAGV